MNKPIVISSINVTFASDSPTSISLGVDRVVETEALPYQKRGLAKPEWEIIKFNGWIEDVREVVISNLEGNFSKNPTERELEEVKNMVILLGVKTEGGKIAVISKIPPKFTTLFIPEATTDYWIRCSNLCAKYRLVAFPC